MPPRPTAENCSGSPTSATRQPLHVGEVGQLGELGGGHHPGLVDDHRRADREVVAVVGWPV